MGDTARPEECREIFLAEVVAFETRIRPCLPAQLPDQTRAAFVSAAYNIGARAFCGSSMSRRTQAGGPCALEPAARSEDQRDLGGRMPRYFVTMSNEAHGYYYPPREVPFEAPDARAAREAAQDWDHIAEIHSVRAADPAELRIELCRGCRPMP